MNKDVKEIYKKLFALSADDEGEYDCPEEDCEVYEEEDCDDEDCALNPPEFLIGASNVYRTANFIVRQHLFLIRNSEEGTYSLSCDTYFDRNAERDRAYECYFGERLRIDGKRVPSMLYARHYVK